jgi:hypothetical protein
MYEDLVELIRSKQVAFPAFGDGVSEEAIRAAENSLGVSFSKSFRWWLQNYGGGQIGGDIVYGIDEDRMGMPDIVTLHQADVAEGVREAHELVFCLGNEEVFYFDTRGSTLGGEYQVFYRELGHEDEEYAASFDEFLRKRIPEVMG